MELKYQMKRSASPETEVERLYQAERDIKRKIDELQWQIIDLKSELSKVEDRLELAIFERDHAI